MSSTHQAVERPRLPFRRRLVARTRLIAFAGILVVVALALALSWVVIASAGASTWSLAPIHLAAFVALASLAWVFARRSSRVVEALFRAEDRMMLAVVHEVNRPLSRLVAAVDEGLSGAEAPEAALKETSNHADALRDLIDALLEAARVATGAVALPTEIVSLGELAAQLESRDVSGRATIELDAAPVVVVGSSRLLRLAMTNLVRNAAQHGYHGGPGAIGVRVDDQGVTITDDGPGMDEAQLDELRTHESWIGLHEVRIGMGLAIAAWVTEVHGGTLLLDNRPGGGLQVCMELPVQRQFRNAGGTGARL